MADLVSFAASLLTIVAALRGCYVCMREVENSPRKATAESRQLRNLYRTIRNIAKGLNNGTLLACEKTCSQVSASVQRADELMSKFRKSTAFLRIKSAKHSKFGWIVRIGRAVKKLCGKIRYCCTNTKAIIYEMERLSKRVSRLGLKEKPNLAQEKAEPRDQAEPTQERREPAEEMPEPARDKPQPWEKPKHQEQKKGAKRTSKNSREDRESHQTDRATGPAVWGFVVGAIVVGSWGGAAIGGAVGGLLGYLFSS